MKLLYRMMYLVLLFSLLQAQDVSIVATVDSQSVTIGDWIHLGIEVRHPAGTQVFLPALKDSLGTFEIVHQDSATSRDENGTSVLSKNIIISKYVPGNFYVPPIPVMFTSAGGALDSALSNPIPVEVRGIQVDTTQSIRDIKGPLTVPMSAEEIAIYIGLFLLAAGAVYGLYYYIKRRRKPADIMEEELPSIPPDVEAMQKLDELDEQHLWQAGEVKQFYSKATEIVREYFEKRYGINALEMTTGEVMAQLSRFRLDSSVTGTIERFLSDADLVKFAKLQPVASENEEIVPTGKAIVERTKPASVSEQPVERDNEEGGQEHG